MTQLNIAEAKAHPSEVIQKVLLGEEIIIAKDHKPLVKIVPIETTLASRQVTVQTPSPQPSPARGEGARKSEACSTYVSSESMGAVNAYRASPGRAKDKCCSWPMILTPRWRILRNTNEPAAGHERIPLVGGECPQLTRQANDHGASRTTPMDERSPRP